MLLTIATHITNGLSLIHEGTDILNSCQVNNPLMRFIDPNWDTNNTHGSQGRVSEIHDIKLLGLGTRLPLQLAVFLCVSCICCVAFLMFLPDSFTPMLQLPFTFFLLKIMAKTKWSVNGHECVIFAGHFFSQNFQGDGEVTLSKLDQSPMASWSWSFRSKVEGCPVLPPIVLGQLRTSLNT